MLFKFLVEFATWNWDNYCLSLQGPIPLTSFPTPKGEVLKAVRMHAFSQPAHLPPLHILTYRTLVTRISECLAW